MMHMICICVPDGGACRAADEGGDVDCMTMDHTHAERVYGNETAMVQGRCGIAVVGISKVSTLTSGVHKGNLFTAACATMLRDLHRTQIYFYATTHSRSTSHPNMFLCGSSFGLAVVKPTVSGRILTNSTN